MLKKLVIVNQKETEGMDFFLNNKNTKTECALRLTLVFFALLFLTMPITRVYAETPHDHFVSQNQVSLDSSDCPDDKHLPKVIHCHITSVSILSFSEITLPFPAYSNPIVWRYANTPSVLNELDHRAFRPPILFRMHS